MSLIHVQNLTFAYDGSYDTVFENVSLMLDTDWKLGFTGRNGRGKTTFLNLLMGKYKYSGTISANVHFDYFPFHVSDPQAMAVDIAETVVPEFEYWRLQKELNKLKLTDEVLYRPFETLSNGEQTKVLLAMLFMREDNFLLIDEPTNHLDMAGREIIKDYLNSKKGFILVSHDRTLLDGCVDHILSINKTNIEVQQGNFSSWYENKIRQDHFEMAENERLKKEIHRLKASASQAGQWADRVESTKIGHKQQIKYEKNIGLRSYIGEKSRRMQQRRKNLERRQNQAIEDKKQLLKNVETTDALKLSPLKYHAPRLIWFNKVSFGYEGWHLCDNVSFEINTGDRIAICGANGCGKSSILKMILNIGEIQNLTYEGQIQIGSGLKISYVPQRTDHLKGSLTDYARQKDIDESLFKAILRKMDFERVQFEKSMEDFSEGQKKKVLIAGSLCEKAHLYIWDEPLNFIDIFSRMQIEEMILSGRPTMLFVEHDRRFAEKIATKMINLDDFAAIDNPKK